MTYLQFKLTADKLVLTQDKVTPKDLHDLLGKITTEEEIEKYYKRWIDEKKHTHANQSPKNKDYLRTQELGKALSITRATLESTADAILIIDNNGKLVDFNQKFLEITEVPPDIIESGEANAGLAYFLTLLEDPDELAAQIKELTIHPEKESGISDMRFKNGKIVERYSQPHRIGNEVVGRVWRFRDVTEKRKQEESLRLTNLAITASAHGIILIENNTDHTITYLNPASISLLNLDEKTVIQKPFLSILNKFSENIEQFSKIFEAKQKERLILQCHINNKILWLEINIDPVYEKNQKTISHFVGIINDITKNKELESILQYNKLHDVLTGLPNKTHMEEIIRYRINKAQQNEEIFALLFIDIDRFKNVNDTLGHHIGDKLLCMFSKRIQNNLDKQDVMARIGGDALIILINAVADIDSLNNIANRLLECCRKKFTYGEHEFNITASIGIVHFPECGTDSETLIRNADIAMYQAKKAGRNRKCFYTKSLDHTVSRRVEIENELHNAIQNNEFELYYQPIFDFTKNKFSKVEALIRWSNNDLGQVPPAEFIPIAEDIDIITTIGRWVTETAIAQLCAWEKKGLTDLIVSINVSVKQLMDEKFVDHINYFIIQNKLLSKKIILEITESLFLREEKVADRLNKLSDLGVQIAIDDFGSGYSNLNYLNKLNISYLKIDKSFIDTIDQNNFNDSVLLAIIAMAKKINFKTIAEGVETQSQIDFLKENECDEVQGYYFSKPLPVKDFEEFIKSQNL